MFNRVAGWHRSHSYEYADAIRTYCLSALSELGGLIPSYKISSKYPCQSYTQGKNQ